LRVSPEELPPSTSLSVLGCESAASEGYSPDNFDIYTGASEITSGASVRLGVSRQSVVCSRKSCSFSGFQEAFPFRRAMLGGPFYVAHAVPTVLEYCQDYEGDEEQPEYRSQSLPGRGRRLITFTDSR